MKQQLADQMLAMRANREFAELLSYAYLFDAQTVMHKDGALSAHFHYVAQDVDSSGGAILDANAHAVFQALALLDDGWMVETNLISTEDTKYASPGSFPDIVSSLVDDARRFHFEQESTFFKSTCYLSLTYAPTDLLGKKLSRYAIDGAEQNQSIDEEHRYFEATLSRFLTHFAKITASPNTDEKASSNLTRLGDDQLISFLHQCIGGRSEGLKSPKVGYFLDSFLSHQHFLAGAVPKIGEQSIKVLAIDDLPESTYPAILDELNFLGFSYRWSSRFIALSKETAERYLKSIKNRWSNKAIGLLGAIKMSMGIVPQIDEAAQENKERTQQSIKENSAGDVGYGFMTSVIILMHQDYKALQDAARTISKTIESLGFKVREESFNATEGYLGSIPAHGGYNIRKPLVDTIYVAHALPISSVWQGSEYAPCPFYLAKSPALAYVRTKGARTFRLNLHVGDVGHFMVLGPTGTGKSTLLALMGCQFRKYSHARIIVFDKDYSNRSWLWSLGGQYFDVYGGAQFAPLASLSKHRHATPAYDAEMSFLVAWLCEICELQHVTITPDQRKKIEESLRALAQSGQEHLRLDLLHIQDPQVRQAIDAFNQGAISHMMNGLVDQLGGHQVIGMEMGQLLKLPESIYIPVVRAVFHRLTSLFHDRKPTMLILEEAWSFIRHPIFEEMLEDWLLTLRKFNVAVGFISQNIEHVTNSRISGTIKESCPTKIFLPNHNIFDEDIAKKYQLFGLNEQQIAIVGASIPKQDYYITSPIGNRLMQLDLSDLELAFMGINKEKDIAEFKKRYQPDNPQWVLSWLEYKGLSSWRDYVERCYFQGEQHG